MNEQATRFPLSWPSGWKRTPFHQRRHAAFSRSVNAVNTTTGAVVRGASTRALTVADAITRLSGELARLGATKEILSTNVETRLDGMPRSGQPEPSDPGAAVYFTLKGAPRCLACDKWKRVADNIAAIAQHIDALRRIDRYGVGTLEQAFAGYAALPPSAEDWWLVLGVRQDASTEQIEEAFKALARVLHPDVGGDSVAMAKLTEARVIARRMRP